MTRNKAPHSEQACAIALELLKEFQSIDNEFPIQYAVCLLEIARDEGLTLTALAERTDMALSTISRIIGALSDNRQKGEAFYLVDAQVSSTSRRSKALHLTRRGRSLIQRIEDVTQKQRERRYPDRQSDHLGAQAQ